MKKILLAGMMAGLILVLAFPAMGTKFSFDLAKGSVLFKYTITGAYNPLHIDITLTKGYAETHIDTEGYNNDTTMEGGGTVSFSQLASTHAVVVEAEVDGNLSTTTTTSEGVTASVNFTGQGKIDKETADELDPNYEKIEIQSGVYADAQAGRVIIEDSTSNPDLATIMSQKLPIARMEARGIIDEFGRYRANYALDNTLAHNSRPWGNQSVGGGGVVIENSISTANLSPAAVFQLSLRGLKYNGYLKNSTVYMQIYPSDNGVQITDLDVNITIVGPSNGGGGNVVLYDVFPYSYAYECYYYPIDKGDWLIDVDDLSPGAYELHIDVGRMQAIRLPITVTEDKKVIPRNA